MAKTNLSGVKFVKFGYGQLEPNHLSARRNGKIYAQLPAKADIEMLQNGQFVKYNYAAGVVDFEGEGPWMLVFNEPKVYEDRQTNADFAMKKEDYAPYGYSLNDDTLSQLNGVYNAANDAMPAGTSMVPRVMTTDAGDIMTINLVDEESLVQGDKLAPNAKGILDKASATAATECVWQVAKVYTMPDGQPGVKLIRIK